MLQQSGNFAPPRFGKLRWSRRRGLACGRRAGSTVPALRYSPSYAEPGTSAEFWPRDRHLTNVVTGSERTGSFERGLFALNNFGTPIVQRP